MAPAERRAAQNVGLGRLDPPARNGTWAERYGEPNVLDIAITDGGPLCRLGTARPAGRGPCRVADVSI
ncbi:MAG: hypothetical protein CL424_14135 [Acidimicrobiaceae bacterium]|nr:hypothetical protein [Acidimicrobiaceae bacterium]